MIGDIVGDIQISLIIYMIKIIYCWILFGIDRIILCQMSCYICYKLFHKVAKLTTSLFRQVITTKVYKRIKQQTGKSTGPMGFDLSLI